MAIRTFLALELDEPIRRAIVAAAESLDVGGAKIRWVAEPNLHVTLKFLGDVPDSDVMDVCKAAESVAAGLAPIAFDVTGLTCVGPRGPVKMIWADIRDEARAIGAVFDEVEAALEPLGFDAEPRAYKPHVTVARVRYCPHPAEFREAAARYADAAFGTQRAGEIVVYSSQLTREGPVYDAMARCPLGP